MAAVEVPQTLEYRDGQLNAAPVLEVENFTNWKPEGQWTANERKAANLDQRLKSLILFVLPDDQMNSVINCLTAKSTWDDLILYHKGPSDVKESKVIDLKLCYNTFKFKEDSELASLFGKLKYEENLIDIIYKTEKSKYLVSATPLSTAFFSSSIVQDFQDSPDDEEDTRSSHEYLNDLEEEYQARALLAKSKRFFKRGTQKFCNEKETNQTECHKCSKKGHFARDCWSKTSVPSYQSPFQSKLLISPENKPKPRQIEEFEAKYHKVKAKLALLSSSASASSSSSGKNKGLIAETYDWDDEELSPDKNEVTKVKALMALTNKERVSVGKESARNGDWTKISMKKVHTLLQMEDNDDRKSFLDYLCIDLNYVEEQRNNILSKYRNLVQELNTCKEQLLVLKQAKLDLLTMQHANIEILKENQNLKFELKELTSITETWLNSSNIVNQCINEDTSSFGSKEPSSETEDSTLPNQDTDEVPSNESQRNTTNPLVVFSDSSVTNYDSADESSVCSTPLLPLKKLDGAEHVSGPKTIKSILKSKSTFKAEILKGITINEPSSAPARGKSSSASKTNCKKKSSYSRNKNAQHVPPNALQNKYKTQFKMNYELYKPVVFKAPKPSSITERVPQGTKHGAQLGHKKQSSLKQSYVSRKETTKGGSSKAPTGSKTSHSKKRKESILGMDSNPSQPPVSTTMDLEMHKEDQQATGGPTSLEVTTKGGSSKAPTGSKTSHSKKRKESISGMDSNLSQPPVAL
ncbi:retrovirus-related pol polyprotein from transposon TNT 1-94 [Tanacetum coccineum]